MSALLESLPDPLLVILSLISGYLLAEAMARVIDLWLWATRRRKAPPRSKGGNR